MRRPNNLTLDFESGKNLNSAHYWAVEYTNPANTPLFLENTNIYKKYLKRPFFGTPNHDLLSSSEELLANSTKLTVLNSRVHVAELLKPWETEALGTMFEPTLKVNDPKTLNYFLNSMSAKGRDAYMYKHLTDSQYTKRRLRLILQQHSNTSTVNYSLNSWESIVNINFLRKERLYTKLKYSRSPAYDIVSGGAAALLAGFIGFLISEKFGYELVDSGDFYYLFMYGVFAAFSLRPLLTVSDSVKGFWDMLSPKRVLVFYSTLVKLVFKCFR
jgi:hypothetical protein